MNLNIIKILIKKFVYLIGYEFDLFALSSELLALGCEDILLNRNLDKILESGEMTIKLLDYEGYNIQILFHVITEVVDVFHTKIYIEDVSVL